MGLHKHTVSVYPVHGYSKKKLLERINRYRQESAPARACNFFRNRHRQKTADSYCTDKKNKRKFPDILN